MHIKTDFLVLGSGIAGLCFAIRAADLGTVAIVTKKEKVESNTNYAQGGIATVTAGSDSFDFHIKDTLESGAGLCKEPTVRMVVTQGPDRIKDLIDWGVHFTLREEPYRTEFDLGKEGGHSHRRVLHAKDLTGREIERALTEKVSSKKTIQIYENHFAVNLICESQILGKKGGKRDTCIGAYVFDIRNNEVHTFQAQYVVLATGGAGKVYLITTNP
ncbi:MAG: FAD-binding protein, partial [Deltaproteobacteria bacterium]|nr:FAD-binding protein [Deltaproteobacteria bacterium]